MPVEKIHVKPMSDMDVSTRFSEARDKNINALVPPVGSDPSDIDNGTGASWIDDQDKKGGCAQQ